MHALLTISYSTVDNSFTKVLGAVLAFSIIILREIQNNFTTHQKHDKEPK